jgi:hypothetical protein
MGLIMQEGRYVGRDEIAKIPTPTCTATWHPVSHSELIEAVLDAVKAQKWQIVDEQYGLARDGQRMFGVMRINQSSSPDWTRAIALRNSHDQSLSVGLAAGISVMCCSNLAFGGTMVLKRRHTSRIELNNLVREAVNELTIEFLNLEIAADSLKLQDIQDDEARSAIVRAAEAQAINSCDVVPIFREFKHPRYKEFAEPTRWALLNAFTERAKRYSPGRADICHRSLTRLFGLDGRPATLFAS